MNDSRTPMSVLAVSVPPKINGASSTAPKPTHDTRTLQEATPKKGKAKKKTPKKGKAKKTTPKRGTPSKRIKKLDQPYTGGRIRMKAELQRLKPSSIVYPGMAVRSKDVAARITAEYAERMKRDFVRDSSRCLIAVAVCATFIDVHCSLTIWCSVDVYSVSCKKEGCDNQPCKFKITFQENPEKYPEVEPFADNGHSPGPIDDWDTKDWYCMEAHPHSCARQSKFISKYLPDHLASALFHIQQPRQRLSRAAAAQALMPYATGLGEWRIIGAINRSLNRNNGNISQKMQTLPDIAACLRAQGHRVKVTTIGANEMKDFIRRETLLRAQKAKQPVNQEKLKANIEYVRAMCQTQCPVTFIHVPSCYRQVREDGQYFQSVQIVFAWAIRAIDDLDVVHFAVRIQEIRALHHVTPV
mgnify:CR=1 FL=1